ncbi:MAG: hypothetical protein ACXW27_05535 [Allosphingosinicella sp.]
MRNPPALLPTLAARPRVELRLRLEDGSPWSLTVSAGIERFIGHYPRLDGLDADGPLLRFRVAGAA